jgi:uncharacterized phage protein (TIGR02216 family)
VSGRFDWQGLMRVGLGRLRLAPDAFWAMSPAEFSAASGAASGAAAAPLGRAGLAALMARFPDQNMRTGDE